MTSFSEWLEDRDPELVEGWGKNLAAAGAAGLIGLGGYGLGQYNAGPAPTPAAKVAQQEPAPKRATSADAPSFLQKSLSDVASGAQQRARDWKMRMGKKSAGKIDGSSATSPGAGSFLPDDKKIGDRTVILDDD